MDTLSLLIAGGTLLAWALLAADLFRGRRWIAHLERTPPTSPTSSTESDPLPAVSVVIAARDEARKIEEALSSVLALDDPALEVIVVDDRSTDGTGEILDRMAAENPRLRVERVTELPPGWLGKNHALQVGAESAAGEFLLFTDADVVFESSALRRAMRVVKKRRLDHLTAGGDVEVASLGLELFVATFALFFNAYFRPWRAADPKSRVAVGIGAFNLVRASAWRRAGTHRAIRMAADDDLRLGRRLKESGARQMFAVAGRLIRVEWYPSLPAAVRGLEKNALAAVDYSYLFLIVGSAAQILFVVWPFVAVFLTDGPARWLSVVAVAVIVGVHLYLLRETTLRAWTCLALPLGTVLVIFTVLRAALLARLRGGVNWRGTFYSLDELRGAGEE